jgi:tetratricopeptide (TPR) repeat protein
MGDYLVAVPYLQKAAASDPQNLAMRMTLAHSCMWSKQYQCVLDVYREILALNAESAEADMLAGEALDEKHDTTGAIEQFRAAAKANPKEPNVHFGLGYLLWTQRQYDEAAREFQAEIENDSQHAQSLEYLGDTYVELRNYPRAQAELEKAVAAAPSSSLAHRDLGIVYVEIGRKDDAIHELQRAAALDPADVAPHWRLARLYQSMGRKDDARVEFTKASTMNKQTNEALYKKMAGGPSARPQ